MNSWCGTHWLSAILQDIQDTKCASSDAVSNASTVSYDTVSTDATPTTATITSCDCLNTQIIKCGVRMSQFAVLARENRPFQRLLEEQTIPKLRLQLMDADPRTMTTEKRKIVMDQITKYQNVIYTLNRPSAMARAYYYVLKNEIVVHPPIAAQARTATTAPTTTTRPTHPTTPVCTTCWRRHSKSESACEGYVW